MNCHVSTHTNNQQIQLWIERMLCALPLLVCLVTIFFASSGVVLADSAMPWEGPLCKVAMSLKGPVAKSVAVIAIVVSGLMLAVGEVSGIFKTMLGLLCGISMAILASNWLGFIDSASSSFSCSTYSY